jgi:hypothetical protein
MLLLASTLHFYMIEVQHYIIYILYVIQFFFLFLVLGFEHRPLNLLGRYTTTWTIHCSFCFSDRILNLYLGQPGFWLSYLCLPCSWDDRHTLPCSDFIVWDWVCLTFCLGWLELQSSWSSSLEQVGLQAWAPTSSHTIVFKRNHYGLNVVPLPTPTLQKKKHLCRSLIAEVLC